MSQAAAVVARYKAAMSEMAISLAIFGAAWFYFKLNILLAIAILVCILCGPAFPPRYAWIANLLGCGGLAALAYFYFGNAQAATVLSVAAVVLAAWSFVDKRRPPAHTQQ
jgi:hypothetical protein